MELHRPIAGGAGLEPGSQRYADKSAAIPMKKPPGGLPLFVSVQVGLILSGRFPLLGPSHQVPRSGVRNNLNSKKSWSKNAFLPFSHYLVR